MIEATIVEFLRLPNLPYNFSQFDISMLQYISGVKSGYDTRIAILLPLLKRILQFGDKEISKEGKEKVERDEKCIILQYCSRINALYHLKTSLECLKEKFSGFCEENYFNASINSSQEGVEDGSVSIASEIIYIDLKHVLCDILYVGDVTSFKIKPFVKDLQVDARVRGVVVASVIVRARSILFLFRPSTKLLIEKLKYALQFANFSHTSTQFALPLSGGEGNLEAATQFFVLFYRREREASDFIKEDFKLPKQ